METTFGHNTIPKHFQKTNATLFHCTDYDLLQKKLWAISKIQNDINKRKSGNIHQISSFYENIKARGVPLALLVLSIDAIKIGHFPQRSQVLSCLEFLEKELVLGVPTCGIRLRLALLEVFISSLHNQLTFSYYNVEFTWQCIPIVTLIAIHWTSVYRLLCLILFDGFNRIMKMWYIIEIHHWQQNIWIIVQAWSISSSFK